MRQRQKYCHLCKAVSEVCYRIQYDASQTWQLVCPDCRRHLAVDNPHYRYGGTWKAKKRRKS